MIKRNIFSSFNFITPKINSIIMVRKATVDVINEINETRNELNKLINRFKNLEDALKGLPSRNYVINIRKYLETIKNNYLKRFEDDMLKLRRKSEEAMRKHAEMLKKLQRV